MLRSGIPPFDRKIRAIFIPEGCSLMPAPDQELARFQLLTWRDDQLMYVKLISPDLTPAYPVMALHPIRRTRADGSPMQPGDTSWQCSDRGRDDL